MTVQVRWLADKDTYRRVLRPKDFKQLGVAHNQEETFEKGNNFTISMDDAAGELLASKLPNEFIVLQPAALSDEVEGDAPDGSEGEAGDQSIDESSDEQPDGSSSESEGEENEPVDESPVTSRRKS